MTTDDLIPLLEQAGICQGMWFEHHRSIERLAALVAAAECEKVARWIIHKGYATGHGDTIEDLLTELEWQVAEREREACAKACEKLIDTFSSSQYKTGQPWSSIGERFAVSSCAAAIRARGEA